VLLAPPVCHLLLPHSPLQTGDLVQLDHLGSSSVCVSVSRSSSSMITQGSLFLRILDFPVICYFQHLISSHVVISDTEYPAERKAINCRELDLNWSYHHWLILNVPVVQSITYLFGDQPTCQAGFTDNFENITKHNVKILRHMTCIHPCI
jgi:hypothetical protein